MPDAWHSPEKIERRASGIVGRETRGNPEPTYASSGSHLKSGRVNPPDLLLMHAQSASQA